MIYRILVTNDDGINAPGLAIAEKIALEIADGKGEVITVAPEMDQSGMGHSISYLKPTLLHKRSNIRYSIEGSPADCILAGVHHIMKANPPNLIISGVNNGHNISEDIVYSGTVGAAMEGALQGIKSISLSQCYSKDSILFDDSFDSSRALGVKVCEQLLDKGNWKSDPYQTFYNINFPAAKFSDVKGVVVCKQGKRQNVSFSVDPIQSPSSRTFLMVNHKTGSQSTVEPERYKSDLESIKKNFITVTPLKADLTCYDELTKLKNIFNDEF